jgi:hypothetical protein
MSIDACQHCEGSMFYAKPSRVASSCVDTATLSLPAPSAPHQGDGAPNPAWNDEMMAEWRRRLWRRKLRGVQTIRPTIYNK